MAIQDQYYVPKHEQVEESEDLITEREISFRLQEMFDTNWVHWDEIGETERNVTVLVHAPSSLLDMRRITTDIEDYIGLKDGTGDVARTEDSGGLELGLLRCTNLGTDWFIRYIEETSELLNLNAREVEQAIEEIGKDYKEYGAFQPAHLGRFKDDEGVNPVLFSVAVALKLKMEADKNKHAGRLCLVSHPDQLYFMANGDSERMSAVAKKIGQFTQSLEIEVFVENPTFANPIFKNNLGWMEDPRELAKVLSADSSTLGLCIDGKHLEDLGYTGRQVDLTLKELHRQGYNLALHVNHTYSVNDSERPYIATAYKNALPIAYEPRNGI